MIRRTQESGNIFFALFGAVGLVGILGASTMTIYKGPVTSMHNVTQRTIAENNMIAAGKLALMAATNQTDDGDCDADTAIEPVPFATTGTGPHPAGGGYLPDAIGAAQEDPWGNMYGYCAWDHGTVIKNGTCTSDAGRLAGSAAHDGAALAVISSGPDRVFQTSCAAAPDYVVRAQGSDDVVLEYTYDEAGVMSGGLWALKEGEPTTATIDRDIEVDGAFRMGTAGEDPGQVGMAACTGGTHIGRMRFNPIDNAIEVCGYKGGTYGWETLAAAGGSVPVGTISAFNATECPANWEAVTELAGRTLMGVGGGYALGDTGGAATIVLTPAQLPAHAHVVDPPNAGTTAHSHAHNVPGYTSTSNQSELVPGAKLFGAGDGVSLFWTGTTADVHAHTVDIGAFWSQSTGSNQAHENRPPFRAYLFCVYMGGGDGVTSDTFNDLQDVDTSGAQDNDILVWNEDAGQWLTEAHWVKDGTNLFYEGGNVGIGTASPANALEIHKPTPIVVLQDTDNTQTQNGVTGHISFRDSGGNQYGWIGDGQTGNNVIRLTGLDRPVALNVDGSDLLTANTDGSVQIDGTLTVGDSVTATAYYQSSDRNLKTDIETINDPFALLDGIEGKHFLWKDSGKGAYGVIAQDVEAVMPEAIGENDEGYKTVEYSQLIAPLIEAVKQLDDRVKALEADNDNLREELRTLNAGAR